MIDGFLHEPPTDDHYYEEVCFKRNVIAIFLVYRPGYLFNDNNPHRTIWGFYDTKKNQFHAPINCKKVGSVVDIRDTTPFTAMQLNLEHFNPLELALFT